MPDVTRLKSTRVEHEPLRAESLACQRLTVDRLAAHPLADNPYAGIWLTWLRRARRRYLVHRLFLLQHVRLRTATHLSRQLQTSCSMARIDRNCRCLLARRSLRVARTLCVRIVACDWLVLRGHGAVLRY